MQVFGVIGWKNTGKTTLVERLVTRFTSQGLRMATIKHTHHAFEIDHAGRDSYRHRMAGASQVLVASRMRWALIQEMDGDPEPSLADHLARLAPCDLVLIEGYKTGGHPKLESWRAAARKAPRAAEDPSVLAVAADSPPPGVTVPVFDLDDVPTIADFILKQTGLDR